MLTTLAVGWQTLKSKESGHFRKVACMSIIDVGGPCSL